MSSVNPEIQDLLDDLITCYTQAKKIFLLSESKFGSSLLGGINEFRNAFDHVMRSYANGPNLNPEELKKAISHLKRLTYDTYEVISLSYFESINSYLEKFSISTIIAILPNYYSETLPSLEKIQNKISVIRTDLDKIVTKDDLSEYEMTLKELEMIYRLVLNAIGPMTKYNEEAINASKKSNRNTWLIAIASAIVSGILVIVVEHFIFN